MTLWHGRGLNVNYWLLDWNSCKHPDWGFKSGMSCNTHTHTHTHAIYALINVNPCYPSPGDFGLIWSENLPYFFDLPKSLCIYLQSKQHTKSSSFFFKVYWSLVTTNCSPWVENLTFQKVTHYFLYHARLHLIWLHQTISREGRGKVGNNIGRFKHLTQVTVNSHHS